MNNKSLITVSVIILSLMWSAWLMAIKWAPPDLTMNLGIAEQQKIYAFEPTIYLDNKPLPSCSDDIETRVCTYSCAPDGVCIFVPRELITKYKFK